MSRVAKGIVRFRWLIIVGFVAVALFFGSRIPRAEIESDIKGMLPSDMESRINTDQIDELFGGTDMLMVILKSNRTRQQSKIFYMKLQGKPILLQKWNVL